MATSSFTRDIVIKGKRPLERLAAAMANPQPIRPDEVDVDIDKKLEAGEKALNRLLSRSSSY